jgi:hypothetical protein
MKTFDSRGYMVFSEPHKNEPSVNKEELDIVKKCYCHNDHNLIDNKALFNRIKGIMIKVKQ